MLVTVDTLRADHLGAYGYSVRDTSPVMDSLIGSGIRFERAMAPRSLTWPSLASTLSGRYPRSHGVTTNGYSFDDRVATLPKLLTASGYQTGAFLGNMCKANHQGWDHFDCVKDPKIARKALDWLGGLDRSRPFLLWTHYFGPHAGYQMGGGIGQSLDPGYEGPVRTSGAVLKRLMREGIALDSRDVQHLNAIYDAAIMGTDERIGDLMTALEAGGFLDNTVVVFVADHGEELYEHHDYIFHACSVYQNGLRVPMAIAAQDLLPAAVAVSEIVEVLDLLPTLLELLGIEPPSGLEGRSVLRHLEEPETRGWSRPAFSEWPEAGISTVVAGDWKLVDNPNEYSPTCVKGAPADFFPIAATELYNLAEDPNELVNLAASRPDKVKELEALIAARFKAVADQSQEQDVPDELKAQLRAMGYITK